MPAIPYAINAYRRTTGRLPELRLVNSFVERVPDPGEPVVLIARPALEEYADLGSNPVRGVFSQPGVLNGDVLAVVGTTLYRAGSAIGTIAGSDRVVFAASDSEVDIVANGVLYNTTGSSVTTVTIPDDQYVTSICFLNLRFIITVAGSARFYWSEVDDGTDFPALNFATAENKPDPLRRVETLGGELWLIGEDSFEFWTRTEDNDLPYIPIEGRFYTRGCIGRDTAVLFDNSIAFVGDDGIVYRGAEVPVRISDHGIEERIENTSPADLRAWAFAWGGHTFYCLTTAQGTYAYDAATQQWCEFSSYGLPFWRAHVGSMAGTSIIAGDSVTGTLWRLTDDIAMDGDDPIQRVFTAHVPLAGRPIPCNSVSIDAAVGQTDVLVGQGSEPLIELRFSRDAGNTWSPWRSASLGGAGSYRTRAAWRRLGIIDEPGRVFEFRLTDPVPFRLSGLRMNELGGGTSR